ncbi:phenylalanine--tRNA ligase subunit beta, partial [Candidatus Saccharibacteria bacterium]|nr:phenylalanine--tRNA ligase subunit beta [Candidatus Saccharibacteria bacterium]
MKIAIETLNRYLKKKRTTDEIVRLIGNTEIEVEEVLGAPSLDPKIILVKITNVEPHPNADRLRIVTITTGKKQYRVVCGAPNVAVEQRVAWVQPGAVLPDGSVIKKAIIRSIESPGMLASGAELGLSDDHSGIVVFEQDTHRLGVSLCD